MFKDRTTIIVGAGASCELGLPSGEVLKQQIIDVLEYAPHDHWGFSDQRVQFAVRKRFQDNMFGNAEAVAQIKQAGSRIRSGLPFAISIDNFLHTHQNDEELVWLGKVAISICLLEAERNSALFKTHPEQPVFFMGRGEPSPLDANSDRVRETWYLPFGQQLMAGGQIDDIAAIFQNVTFIIFNYDRCLEQDLYLALQRYYSITEVQASMLLRGVDFFHPYGSLGPLPWQANAPETLDFGQRDGMNYSLIATSIKTFTESVASDMGVNVSQSVGQARLLIVLGFGFLAQNVKLLLPLGHRWATKVLATAYGAYPDELIAIRQILDGMAAEGRPTVLIDTGTCRELFDHFRVTLGSA